MEREGYRGRGGRGGYRGGRSGGGGGGPYHHHRQSQYPQQQYYQGGEQWTPAAYAGPGPGRGGGMGHPRGGYGGGGGRGRGGGGGGSGGGGGGGGGGGRGRGRGRGRGWVASAPQGPQSQVHEEISPPAQDAAPDPVIGAMQSMTISEQSASTSSSQENINRANPAKRPDNGGTLAIRTCRLRVNHFPVMFNPQSIIGHYDVDIKPEELPKHGRPVKLSKPELSMIRNKLFTDNPSEFPLAMTAYDGEKNIFSAIPLPTGKYKVEFSEGEDIKCRCYTFTIKLVNELKLCKLKDYLSGNLFSVPRDILQGMDVVIKENPTKHMIYAGRSFHSAEYCPDDNLENGLVVSRGIQHSLKPTSQGLALCLDYSVLAFRKRMPVLDFLAEHIHGFNINDFWNLRRVVERVLKNLKVHVTHRITKQKYTIAGLTDEKTRHLKFDLEDPDSKVQRKVRLVDYFQNKYGKNIKYMDIPCLDLGKNNRTNHVPMEFCVLAEGQIYPKDSLSKDVGKLLKDFSLAKPKERARRINEMVQASNGPCGGNIIQNFGLEVNMNMTSVTGRVIGPPELKLAAPTGRAMKITVDREKCQWNLVGKALVEGKSLDCWGVLDFSSSERSYYKLQPDPFIGKLIARCRNLGMRMEKPLLYQCASMRQLSNIDVLRQLLESVTNQAYKQGKGRLQILLCVMSGKDDGYKYLKWISETRIGVVTQCCLSTHANKGQDQYLANLALKINAKLGGSNVELIDRLPFLGESLVMFVGADVNHPAARNKTSPSIAAVVATVNWPAANRYAARVRPQDHRKEKIVHFGDMCLELAEHFARLNQVKPEKIVIFRDGVSESQFDMVLNEELIDLKRTFQAVNYFPIVTVIVAQKRHQTRFFPESERDGGSTGNVPPGTVVDTKVVHPFEFDFYLCSHYGSLGTSKPTHYYVLWDEHGFSSDGLQQLIYNMCFTFSRCTKPVSLVPPVYYADLVAYRGRQYHEAMLEGRSPASLSSSSSLQTSSSFPSAASFDDLFKLHADLENVMFFV